MISQLNPRVTVAMESVVVKQSVYRRPPRANKNAKIKVATILGVINEKITRTKA
ncbi:MAG: hypothetical protein ABDI20_02075 [Candidatus Bipolaricaulaceae bacterium]